ncbi:MAG: RluA family pseudouridine synthase [Alphaproteobacteria bacterium]|nr:RluA family pseudouridine synthase [Alphaproteobacteria bacterium]
MSDADNIYTTPIVNKDFKGKRIDKFLAESFPFISRSQIQRIIELGNVLCDDITIIDNSYKIKSGESYILTLPEAEPAEPLPQNIPLDIVYQDADIVVVNKPAGMVVHPAAGAPDRTLVNALLYWCDGLSGIGGIKRPGIVHRIDKDTSGLLVVAKNDTTHRFLCEQFAEHSIERTYYAFCHGCPSPACGVVSGQIGRSPRDRKKMAVLAHGGKHAVTHYQVVSDYHGAASKIKCNLETGRTHQIRVHLSSLGHHLLGDQVYTKSQKITLKGAPAEALDYINHFPRQALHAQTLGFIHPATHEKMLFSSDLPADLAQLEQALLSL